MLPRSCFLLFGGILLLQTAARSAAPTTTSDLSRDPRLSAAVTLHSGKAPLSALLRELGRQAKVPVRASPEVADEPAILFVAGLPATEVMTRLATHFDYRWRGVERPDGLHWTLHQDLSGRRREEQLRAREGERSLVALQAELRERLALSRKSPESLLAAADAYDAAEGAPQRMAALPNGPEYALMRRERSSRPVRELASTYTRALLGLVAGLPEEAWGLLLRRAPLRFSTLAEPGVLPMPRRWVDALRASTPWHFLPPGARPHFAQEDGPEIAARSEALTRSQWRRAAGYRVRILLDVETSQEEQSARLRVNVNTVMPDLSGEQHMTGGPLEIRGHAGPPDAVPITKASASDPILARSAAWEPLPREAPPGAPSLEWLNRDLAQAAAKYRINFLADAYRHPRYTPGPLSARREVTLREWLDAVVTPLADWERKGEWLLVRRRKWFVDRPAEIPARTAEAWAERFRKREPVGAEELAKLLLELRDEQLPHLNAVLRERGVEVSSRHFWVQGDRQFLRAYGLLTPAQRQLLRAGGQVPFRFMPVAAGRWLEALFEERSREEELPSAASVRAGRLTAPAVTRAVRDGRLVLETEGRSVVSMEVPPGEAPPPEQTVRDQYFVYERPDGKLDYFYALPPVITVLPRPARPESRLCPSDLDSPGGAPDAGDQHCVDD